MAVKIDGLDGSEPKAPLQTSSRFDSISKEDMANIFDDLVVESNAEDGSEACSLSIALATSHQQDRALRAWNHPKFWDLSDSRIFVRSIKKAYPNANPDQVWVNLCKNDATAFCIIKAFLKFYVASSKQEWLTLGPEEHVIERAVKLARSLNAFWKALITAADAEVLSLLWQRSMDNYQLVLKCPKNYPSSAEEGPVSKISHWIYHEGAEEMGLATVPEYTTVEMTARDIGVILRTLWLFADWIPMTPFQHVIFHTLIILFSLGFRQGMITGMKFQDVPVAMVRDPVDPMR
ncbi:hypothetical protein FRB94_014737 [Tulasnella sp. JGI-2019a]|nr:hypothetical protein FRB93_011030 [Tulasnella sp. JGI-2019a]KAG8989036.1 hypothetical protein FRB94_014737 [Tulasnella sp. JGI-2019a]